MITSKIAANQAFAQVNRMHKVDDASRQHHGRDEAIKTPKGETIDGIKAEISSFSLNPSHQFNTEFNAVVKSIRIADKAMGEIETNIEQMESEVEMFIKQYPPFPPGSEDRVKLSEPLCHAAETDRSIDISAGCWCPADYRSVLQWQSQVIGRLKSVVSRSEAPYDDSQCIPVQEGLALPEITVPIDRCTSC